MCLLFRMGAATLSNTRRPSHGSWDQPHQMKGWNTLQLIEEGSFFLIHQPLACAFEYNDSLFGMKNYFNHGLLFSSSILLSLFQQHWIFDQNLFNWCFIRKEENWKLSSEEQQAEVHDVPLPQAHVCTDRDLCGKPSASACTQFCTRYLPCPLQSSLSQDPALGDALHPHPFSSMNSLNHPCFRIPLPGLSLTNYIQTARL